jgi:hypothetical protein
VHERTSVFDFVALWLSLAPQAVFVGTVSERSYFVSGADLIENNRPLRLAIRFGLFVLRLSRHF